MAPAPGAELKALRAGLRRRRAALPPAEAAELSLAIARRLWREPVMARAQRVACYMAVGGEVDCAPVVAEAARRGVSVYLPVLHGEVLVFAAWDPAARLLANRYGIPEPADGGQRWLRGTELDVVLAPLVAFDERGHRLGMGGGYYDRTFSFRRSRGAWRRPRLVGLGYEFQCVRSLPRASWDVPLDAAITERASRRFPIS
jgi:5-formyltetrahydrofolate cyclo-ligase